MIRELLKIASEEQENEQKLSFVNEVLEKEAGVAEELLIEIEELLGTTEEHLEKVGFDWSSVGQGIKDFASSAKEPAGKMLGAAGVGVASIIGSALVNDMYGAARSALTRNRNYERMLEADPELKDHPANKVKAYFNTLHEKGGPDMSSDPLIASGFVRQQLELNRPEFVYEGVHKLVQTRQNLEKSKPGYSMDLSKLIPQKERTPDQTTHNYYAPQKATYNGPIGTTYNESPQKGKRY